MKRRTFLGATLAAISAALSAASFTLRAVAAQVAAVGPRPRPMPLPPVPKSNPATDDIDSEDFGRQVQDYERALLPDDIIFPRDGQIWEAVRDCEVNFMAWPITRARIPAARAAPVAFFPFGKARLQQGERVRILPSDNPKPIQVHFQPVRYQELHESIVPKEIRDLGGRPQYVLSLRIAYTVCCPREEKGYFHELFRLVEDVA